MNTHPFYTAILSPYVFALFLFFLPNTQSIGQVDVALQLEANMTLPSIGAHIVFTLTAENIRVTDVGNLGIQLEIPNTLDYVSVNTPSGTSFNATTKEWTIGNQLNENTTSLSMTITLSPNEDGVHFVIAEVMSIAGIEYNSTPQNGDFLEDDLAVACVSIPILINLETNDSVTLIAPSIPYGHQWRKTTNAGTLIVSNDSIFVATEVGIYQYENTEFICEAASCCPIIIEAVELCDVSINEIFCDDNGTVNNGMDDFFSVSLTATSSNTGLGSYFLVEYNGMILNPGGTAYGTAVMTTHPDFLANGVTLFTLLIYDVNDAACHQEITFTAPSSCSVYSDCDFYAVLIENNCCKTCPTGNIEINTAYWRPDYIHLNTVNLALNKPSIFNGTPGLSSSNSALSTDGKYEGNSNTYFDYAFSVAGNYNRWDVDLVGHYDVESIQLFTKTGCCEGDATTYRVFISNAPFSATSYQELLADPNIPNFTMPVMVNGNPTILNNVNTLGRFIRIFLEGTGQMQLVEVEIMGSGNAVSSPYHYSWSDSNIGNIPNPDCLSNGNYEVTVTDIATGCISTIAIEITE